MKLKFKDTRNNKGSRMLTSIKSPGQALKCFCSILILSILNIHIPHLSKDNKQMSFNYQTITNREMTKRMKNFQFKKIYHVVSKVVTDIQALNFTIFA